MSSPRALLHLLFNGARAVDVVDTALRLGLLDACTWPDLAEPAEFRNVSLYHACRERQP